ncbi:hypothetical protein QN277_022435 [Acacia crassicarpa]|uniref:non-specific serine/threonine protein kinase n=1 Tax=Acacia crassicarpa TaxID=499986 RepID=A0AAE1JF61_9FABA|nr:hypothetical protein QN277_022435 [Acacia crassicarpa]
MGMSKSFFCFSFLVGCLVFAVLVQSQDQSGFISIDCGAPAKSAYTEETTGIQYISDEKFINSGVGNSITSELQNKYKRQVWTLRSFPQGTRNCYRINITSGSKYLIRANFVYGNYDGPNRLPKFDLHLGPNLWQTVKITNPSGEVDPEIIHVPSLDHIQICLVDTGSGTPFISAIDLRTLMNDTYVTQFGSLSLHSRLDLGSTSKKTYRYSDDDYDRSWSAPAYNPNWAQINASISSDSLAQNVYKPAAIVMSTAATPVNEIAPMEVSWAPENASDQFYVYMHFAELRVLEKNQTRSFDITVNGDLFYADVVPKYRSTNTVFSKKATSGEKISFLLQRTHKSTLPPILNAIEVYTIKDFSQSETEQGDVDAITTIKFSFGVTRNWQGDPCGPLNYIWEGLNCTYNGQNSPRITALNLSSSGLTGQIDPSITKLTMLEKLDLSNNSLNGPVPDFLSQLQNLKILNLQNNNFIGALPTDLVEKSKKGSLLLSVGQNPYLCESPPCNKKKKNNIIIPVVASVGGVLILVVATATLFLTLKRRKPRGPLETSQRVEKIEEKDTSLQVINRQYSYSDVLNMTNNFNTILGKGGFGTVYLGYIEETPVAVKMLSLSSAQGYQQFQAEVKLLMRVHHKNLTSLTGYCNEETNMGLIYEYMAKGNLQDYLSGNGSRSKFLTWEDRLWIALDAAQGLEYLHNGCKPPIIHRDVKSSNILLNENFRAKVADFGLSKIIPTDDGTHVSTVVVGTPGYIDPEYSITNRLTEKSDVFSFGAVLFEIITSLPVILRTHEKIHISDWVNSLVAKGNIRAIVDPRLNGDFDSSSAWRAVEMATTCVSSNPNGRPTMSEVVNELKECLAIEVARTKNNGADTGEAVELVSLNMTSTEYSPLAR